ncbi:MAG: CerR family C-terminal domain-containing protein [Syntrophobacterales bacterium]|jgi:AcrR family transcriptional regulator|nr:CerR family C-terminal domain-containing protein [Syntrophobacterales bacterium]
MKILRKDAEQTRQSLLAAGSAIFADKGYRDTTIAEICERAKANIAAVNYHFGDKETLYRESWRHAFLKSIATHPPDGGVAEDAPPEDRLRGQIAAILHRVADQESKEFLILLKEFANHTGLLKDLVLEEVRPIRIRMEAVLRQILGERASKVQVRFCTISILTQCINAIVAGLTRTQGWEDEAESLKIDNIEEFIDHVVGFSLGGIASIRKTLQSPGGTRKSRGAGRKKADLIANPV